MAIPYTFQNLSGDQPASYLDANFTYVNDAGNATGTLAVANGGTGAATDQAASQSLATAFSVADLAALKALTSRPSTVLVKTGQAAGVWQWVSGSATTPDDGLVVQCSSGASGRYKRVYDGPIMGAWFGMAVASADNSAALGAAITAVNAAAGILSLQPGTFTFTSAVAKTLTSRIMLAGSGSGATILKWTNGSGGLALTYASQYMAPAVSGISFQTTQAGGGTGLTITCSPALATANDVGPIIDDVDVRGFDATADYWDNGITLVDCWYPELTSFSIKGKDEAVLPFSMTAGLTYTRCQGLFLSEFSMQHMTDAVLQGGTTLGEGLNASQFEIVGVLNGFNLDAPSALVPIQGIQDGHINAYARGIVTNGIVQANLSGLLIYKTHVSTSDFVGIDLRSDASNCRVIGNFISDSPLATGTWDGILVGIDASYNSVIGNTFNYAALPSRGVSIGTDANNNIISENVAGASGAAIDAVYLNGDAGDNIIIGNRSASGVAVVNNSGAAQTIVGNSPLPDQVLVVNDTTPSVKAAQHTLWRTNNSNPTTYTALDDGAFGQTVTILLGANDGFTHNASTFVLQGGVDIAVGDGSGYTITFTRYSGKWVEENRSFNPLYAEGSWTPVIAGTVTPGTQSYSGQVGRYIRVGNLVTAWFNIGLSAVDGTIAGNVAVTGLPFTVSNISGYRPSVAVGAVALLDLSVGYSQIVARASENTTQILVQQFGDNIGNLSLPVAALTVGSSIGGTLSYRTG